MTIKTISIIATLVILGMTGCATTTVQRIVPKHTTVVKNSKQVRFNDQNGVSHTGYIRRSGNDMWIQVKNGTLFFVGTYSKNDWNMLYAEIARVVKLNRSAKKYAKSYGTQVYRTGTRWGYRTYTQKATYSTWNITCKDGTRSSSNGKSGVCSGHGGRR